MVTVGFLSSMWVNMSFSQISVAMQCQRHTWWRASSFHLVIRQQQYSWNWSNFLSYILLVGTRKSLKNSGSHIDASHSRQPLVKGERLVRYEVNAVILETSKLSNTVQFYICIIVCEMQVNVPCRQRHSWQHTSQHESWVIRRLMLMNIIMIPFHLLPQRVCCPRLRAMPVQHARAPEQAREDTSPEKK